MHEISSDAAVILSRLTMWLWGDPSKREWGTVNLDFQFKCNSAGARVRNMCSTCTAGSLRPWGALSDTSSYLGCGGIELLEECFAIFGIEGALQFFEG
jgi:hypothetical protein